jgi:hypothetical protein
MFKRTHCSLIVALLVTLTLLRAVPARADHMPEATAAVVDVAVVLPGLALSVPNIVHVIAGRRPAIAWPVLGLVLGIVGAGLSTLTLSDVRSTDNPSLAIAGLAGGAVEIGFATWAWLQPVHEMPQVGAMNWLNISPLLLRNARSGPSYGVAITGVIFWPVRSASKARYTRSALESATQSSVRGVSSPKSIRRRTCASLSWVWVA